MIKLYHWENDQNTAKRPIFGRFSNKVQCSQLEMQLEASEGKLPWYFLLTGYKQLNLAFLRIYDTFLEVFLMITLHDFCTVAHKGHIDFFHRNLVSRKLFSYDRKLVSCGLKLLSCDRKLVSCDRKLVSCDRKLLSCNGKMDVSLL